MQICQLKIKTLYFISKIKKRTIGQIIVREAKKKQKKSCGVKEGRETCLDKTRVRRKPKS